MKIFPTRIALLIGAALAVAAPLSAHAQQAPTTTTSVAVTPGKAVATETTKASAVVVGLDAAARTVSLKGASGKVFDVVAGPEVRNYDQIKVGDVVRLEYVRALSLELKKSGSALREPSADMAAARAPKGGTPGAAVGAQVTVLADVVAVDGKQKLVTLRGPKGNVVDLDVRDPEQLKNIKKGDKVEVVYAEAVAVAVEPMPKAAPKK